MPSCTICGSAERQQKLVEEVFRIDGQYVLVDHIPVHVCTRCGEETFSRETTDRIRKLVRGEASPTRSIAVRVFEFAKD